MHKVSIKKDVCVAKLLRNREIGFRCRFSPGRVHRPLDIQNLPQSINERIDSDCRGTLKHVRSLKVALERKSWLEIEAAVSNILSTIFDK
jgi:hypothetical protein